MAQARGAKVVPRDHSIVAGLAVARYLSAEQIARLAFAGRDESIVRRRLARLSARRGAGLEPLLRFIRYRNASGNPDRAWALTAAGYAVARGLVACEGTATSDVGAAFLEHALVLNGVFVELVLKARRGSGTWYADLPFRWLAEAAQDLTFDYWDRSAQKLEKGRIRPDGTLEIGHPRRRIFLECETGSQSIVSADPMNTGATWAKIQRYAHLIAGSCGQHDARTPYSALYADAFSPVVLFLVRSERRRDGIRKLVADPKRNVKITVRAYTLTEVPEVLGALLLGSGARPEPAVVADPITSPLDLLGRVLLQCHGSFDAARHLLESQRRGFEARRTTREPAEGREDDAVREALILLSRLHPTRGQGLSGLNKTPAMTHLTGTHNSTARADGGQVE